MKTKLLSGLAIATMLLTGCITATSGNLSINNGKDSDASMKKEIQTAEFNEIEASQGIKVIVTQGQFPGKVSVATTPSAEKYLCVKVNDGKLKVYYDNRSITGKKIQGPSIITLTIPELKEADLSSGAYLSLQGKFSSDSNVEFDLSSGSALNIENLTCSLLSLDTSSGATATVQKFSGDIEADSSSGSSISIEQALGGKLSVEASSGSSIFLMSNNSKIIDASASSGGSITLSGSTDELNKSTSSGGSVNVSQLSCAK